MVQLELKGVHRVNMTLRDGTKRTYFYAWRGGPRMASEFGTPEFVAEYHRLTAPACKEETVSTLIALYRGSPEFTSKAAKTRCDYSFYINMIEAKFGSMPLIALADKRARGIFKAWRDGMASQPRKADYAWSILRRIMSFGVDRGMIDKNPCEKGGRLYKADRNEIIWSEDDLTALFKIASPEVAAVVTFALWTGQRQADCLKAKWSDLAVGRIKVRQNKGGRRVTIPVGATLAELLKELPRRGATILTNSHGEQWTSSGFRTSFGKAFIRSGISEPLHFHDLRGTAVTRMALAGCTSLQIASITGHSPKQVDEILQAHYLGGQAELAEQAIRRLDIHHFGEKAEAEDENPFYSEAIG